MGLEEIVRDGMETMESYASGGNPHRRNGSVRGWGGGWEPTLIWICVMCGAALAIVHVSPVLLPAKQKSGSLTLWIRRLRLNKVKQFVQGQPVREAKQGDRDAAYRGEKNRFYHGN